MSNQTYLLILRLTAGGTLAIIAFLIGFSVNRRAGIRMAKIGRATAAAGGPPTISKIEELKELGRKISVAGRMIAIFLIFAVIGMSVFRCAWHLK